MAGAGSATTGSGAAAGAGACASARGWRGAAVSVARGTGGGGACGGGARASTSSGSAGACGGGDKVHNTRKPKAVRATTPKMKSLIGYPLTPGTQCPPTLRRTPKVATSSANSVCRASRPDQKFFRAPSWMRRNPKLRRAIRRSLCHFRAVLNLLQAPPLPSKRGDRQRKAEDSRAA
jgi:hypothetical protein